MGLRIFTEPQQGASYEQLLAIARTAEECGFDAFFRSDHVLKMGAASGLPGYTEAWTTLAGLARETTRLRLGTLVTPVTFRSLGLFAVTATQVDHMSGGRLDVGLGAGWYAAEHEAYGLPFPSLRERYDLLEDQLAILHGVWTATDGERFTYQGRTTSVALDPATVRPQQHPHPPIVLGGRGGPRATRLAALYADEFNTAFVSADAMAAIHAGVRKGCERRDRDPASLVWSVALVACCGANEAELARRANAIGRDLTELRANGLAGTPSEVLDKLGRYAEAGAERFYLQVLDPCDLDHLRLIAEEVLPDAPGK